jgi:hypothetical protein
MPVESRKFDASIRDLRQIRGVTGDLENTLASRAQRGPGHEAPPSAVYGAATDGPRGDHRQRARDHD